jgi:hypothetical protein
VTHVNADTVDTLKREFEKIAGEINPIMLQHKPEHPVNDPKAKAWYDLYYTHPNSNQASTVVKRIQALSKVDSNLASLLVPIGQRLMIKGAEVQAAKDAHLKARNEKKAAQLAKKHDAEETKKNPYRKLHPEVAALLKQVAEPYRVKAVEFETKRLNNQVEEIKSAASMFGSFNPDTMFQTRKGDHWGNQIQYQKRMDAQAFVDYTGTYHNGVWSLKTGIEGIVKAKAERFAEDLVTAFIFKVGTKLSGIVEKKGNLAKTFINGSLQDHWMTFEFRDGAEFQVQSQIVWKTSVNGKHFAQYPTCFRNVKLAGGVKMEIPSEAKMKEAFV